MIGYLQDPEADYTEAFRRLKKAGVEKAYVYPTGYFNFNASDEVYAGYRPDLKWIRLSPEALAELRILDYLFAPWIWLNEIVDSSLYLDRLALHGADGTKGSGWRVGRVQWYDSHEGRVLEMFKQAAPHLRAQYNAALFDVLNAGPCLESLAHGLMTVELMPVTATRCSRSSALTTAWSAASRIRIGRFPINTLARTSNPVPTAGGTLLAGAAVATCLP